MNPSIENHTALAIKLHENLTLEQRVAFAILCAKATTRSKKFHRWADGWVSGRDRTMKNAPKASRSGIALWTTSIALSVARLSGYRLPNATASLAIQATVFALDAGINAGRLLPGALLVK